MREIKLLAKRESACAHFFITLERLSLILVLSSTGYSFFSEQQKRRSSARMRFARHLVIDDHIGDRKASFILAAFLIRSRKRLNLSCVRLFGMLEQRADSNGKWLRSRDFTNCCPPSYAGEEGEASAVSSFHRTNLAPSTTSFVILMARRPRVFNDSRVRAALGAFPFHPVFSFFASSSLICPRHAALRFIVRHPILPPRPPRHCPR